MKHLKIFFIIVVLFFLCKNTSGIAFDDIPDEFREKYPNSISMAQCSLCHISKTDHRRTLYGQDLGDHDFDFSVIEDLDSDCDGKTNKQEIDGLTNPSEPNKC